jgi:nitrogen regulatory protein P-II 2
MKMIAAVIKPFKLDDVREALSGVGVEGLTVTEVRGFGRQRGRAEGGENATAAPSFLPKLKIEVAVPDSAEDKVIKAISKAANTGRIGDGKIFVYDLTGVVRIRTGETGEDAI